MEFNMKFVLYSNARLQRNVMYATGCFRLHPQTPPLLICHPGGLIVIPLGVGVLEWALKFEKHCLVP